MGEWITISLAELCSDISYGYTESARSEEVGPKFLRITDIASERLDWGNVPFCPITKENFEKYKLIEGDIVIARTGATTGANYTLKRSDPRNVVFASYLIRYRINMTIADPFFVGYVLRSSLWKEYVDAIAGGSAQPGANARQLGSYEILLPPVSDQRKISSLLSSIDNKIELLHRQNATLEKMAETIFRRWFIEEAKSGWETRPLSSIAVFLNGLPCQKYPPIDSINRLPVLKIKELTEGITENSDWASSKVKEDYIIEMGDVLFAWSASLMVKLWFGQPCILNQHLFKVTSMKLPKWFYYLWCKFHLTEFIVKAESHATTMGHIKRGDLDTAMVLLPSTEEIDEMNKVMTPLIDKLILNLRSINNLRNLRETLLPKLISGNVRII